MGQRGDCSGRRVVALGMHAQNGASSSRKVFEYRVLRSNHGTRKGCHGRNSVYKHMTACSPESFTASCLARYG